MHWHGLALIFSLLMVFIAASAQPTGMISGSVALSDSSAAAGVTVRLDGYVPEFHSSTQAAPDGYFEWTQLDNGVYFVSSLLMEHGFAFDSQVIADGDTAHLTLILEPAVGDTLTEALFAGTTIVEPANQEHSLPWYFVDVNGDQVGDYHLSFGPPWYDQNYVHRPANNSQISVIGGMFSYSAEPMLIVYYLQDLAWREPFAGHGGFGGTQGYYSLVCHTLDTSGTGGLANPIRIEVKGHAVFDLCGPDTTTPPGVFEFWDIYTHPEPMEITHHLNFGMNRPEPPVMYDSTTVFIVGGLVETEEDNIPWVIVYECNGEFWREPGDTTGLAPMGGNSTHDPFILSPLSFFLSCYPNPFNATTTFSFILPRAGDVKLRIFDLLGQEVESVLSERLEAGDHKVIYSAEHLSSGIYFARLETSSNSRTQKLVILK